MTNDERRDMFAAAALTGLIERRPWPVDKNESATICYQFADAMLRERAATNHDAAPAASGDARAFALTKTERHVLRKVRDIYVAQGDVSCDGIAFAIHGILARLGGEL